MKKYIFSLLVLLGGLCNWTAVHAVITIEIGEGVLRGVPIAIVPFGGDFADEFSFSIDDVIRDDLYRTGRFDPIPQTEYLSTPTTAEEFRFTDWQLIGADYVLIGRVDRLPENPGKFRVVSRLYDSFGQKQVDGLQSIVTKDEIRKAAHRIANAVFEKVTDEKSSFDTKIVYTVTVQSEDSSGSRHVLYYADYDGYNPIPILRSDAPILSPTWSPDFTQVAYAELGSAGSSIFLQNVNTGERVQISTLSGYNSAPSWSPDGERIAFSNSKEGNFDIYIYSLSDGKTTRVTNHRLIDTEPAWSPDGRYIVFTSNRGKGPQIYRARARRGALPQRIRVGGRSNTGASYSPNGDVLVLITDQGNGKQVGIYEFESKSVRVISKTTLDDSAKFSPHGDMLIHVVEGSTRYIKILSPDGRVATRIPVAEGLVKQVDWGAQ